jgi:large subunit ribosomal protein L29e
MDWKLKKETKGP